MKKNVLFQSKIKHISMLLSCTAMVIGSIFVMPTQTYADAMTANTYYDIGLYESVSLSCSCKGNACSTHKGGDCGSACWGGDSK